MRAMNGSLCQVVDSPRLMTAGASQLQRRESPLRTGEGRLWMKATNL